VHAYGLMSNPYPLVVETPNANLVAGRAWLQSPYPLRLNHRHQLIGQVLSGRYKERIIAEELRRLGWQETDLMSRRRHDPGKVQIAVRLRRETTLSAKRIAQRLRIGTPKSASFRLRAVMRNQPSADPAQRRLSL
jgi:hypothetical protein